MLRYQYIDCQLRCCYNSLVSQLLPFGILVNELIRWICFMIRLAYISNELLLSQRSQVPVESILCLGCPLRCLRPLRHLRHLAAPETSETEAVRWINLQVGGVFVTSQWLAKSSTYPFWQYFMASHELLRFFTPSSSPSVCDLALFNRAYVKKDWRYK